MIIPDGTNEGVILERTITERTVFDEYHKSFPQTESFDDLAVAALKGEESAKAEFDRLGFRIGIAVANCVNLFDPELVLLGGMRDSYANLYKDSVIKNIKKHINGEIHIVLSDQDENYTAIGAALMAVDKVIDKFY